MSTANKHRKCPATEYMRHCSTDLIECFFDIGRKYKYVAQICHRDLFTKVNAQFKIVGPVEGRNLPHSLRPKSRTRAIGCASVKRDTENADIEFIAFMNIFYIRHFQECVDASKMR